MSDSPTYSVRLTDAELLLLDGQCSPEAQAEVDAAKRRRATASAFSDLTEAQAALVSKAVEEALSNKKLGLRGVGLRHCDVCGKSAGHYRFKSGRRKGQPDYKRPLSFSGVELADRMVSIAGYASCGCCADCWAAVRPAVLESVSGLEAEIAESLTGEPPRWRRVLNRRCTSCGWEGTEDQMRPAPTLMGDGTYPSGCPKCPAKNALFHTPVEIAKGYSLVPTGAAEGAK